MPADITFKRLHDTIQLAMGWGNEHLYEFSFPESKLLITSDDDAVEEWKSYFVKYKKQRPTKEEDPFGFIARMIARNVKSVKRAKIDKPLENIGECEYIYDFGDYWCHKLYLEQVIEDYEVGYPQLLDGAENCPPDDVGGVSGYREFLKIWDKPEHPEYQVLQDWVAQTNYQNFNLDYINSLMKRFLKLKKIKDRYLQGKVFNA